MSAIPAEIELHLAHPERWNGVLFRAPERHEQFALAPTANDKEAHKKATEIVRVYNQNWRNYQEDDCVRLAQNNHEAYDPTLCDIAHYVGALIIIGVETITAHPGFAGFQRADFPAYRPTNDIWPRGTRLSGDRIAYSITDIQGAVVNRALDPTVVDPVLITPDIAFDPTAQTSEELSTIQSPIVPLGAPILTTTRDGRLALTRMRKLEVWTQKK